jgi:hypothetical protein
MGKPVKKHNKKEDLQKPMLGKRVMCIALGGAIYQCQGCFRVKKRGMFSEYNNNLYCGEYCIKQSQRVKNERN